MAIWPMLLLMFAEPAAAGAADSAQVTYERCLAAEAAEASRKGVLPSIFSDVAPALCPSETDAYREAYVGGIAARAAATTAASEPPRSMPTAEQQFAAEDAARRAELVIGYTRQMAQAR